MVRTEVTSTRITNSPRNLFTGTTAEKAELDLALDQTVEKVPRIISHCGFAPSLNPHLINEHQVSTPKFTLKE